MGFDTGTLIRAAGSGLVGHKKGQLAARDRADFEAREAEDAQTRDIEQQMKLAELQAMQNPVPKPDTYTIRDTAEGTVRINDRTGEVIPLTRDGTQVQPPPRPQTPSSFQRFGGADGMFTFDPSTGRAEPLMSPDGKRIRGLRRGGPESLGPLLNNAGETINRAVQWARDFGGDEEAAADEAARSFGLRDAAHFFEIRQGHTSGILEGSGLGQASMIPDSDTGVGTVGPESRARELKDQGLSDDEIVEIGRSEGWIQG